MEPHQVFWVRETSLLCKQQLFMLYCLRVCLQVIAESILVASRALGGRKRDDEILPIVRIKLRPKLETHCWQIYLHSGKHSSHCSSRVGKRHQGAGRHIGFRLRMVRSLHYADSFEPPSHQNHMMLRDCWSILKC